MTVLPTLEETAVKAGHGLSEGGKSVATWRIWRLAQVVQQKGHLSRILAQWTATWRSLPNRASRIQT